MASARALSSGTYMPPQSPMNIGTSLQGTPRAQQAHYIPVSLASEGTSSSLAERDGEQMPVHPSHAKGGIPPERWCIDLGDLLYFEEEVQRLHAEGTFDLDLNKSGLHKETIGPSVFIVNEKYIKPVTRDAGGMSWALWRRPEGLKCDLFATHCWQEGMFEFISKVKKTWPRGAKGLWACFLAIPQNCDIPSVLGDDPFVSPFALAVQRANHIVVVPNHKTSIYERLWCVFEAYVAMTELESRTNLSIQIPLTSDPFKLMLQTLPGLAFPVIGACVGIFVCGPNIGFILGPVMWLLSTWLVCTVLGRVSNSIILRNIPGHRDSCKFMVVVCYIELMLIGIGSGLAWWHLFGVECDSHMKLFEGLCMPSSNSETAMSVIFGVEHLGFRFEHGEEVSVMLVLISLVLVYMWHIFMLLVRKCIEMEGSLLDFDTVSDATCTDLRDQSMIMSSIQGEERNIDRMIKMLKSIGRYNNQVRTNVELGLPWEACRHGIDYFKLAAAVVTWEFWWVTDACGRHSYHLGLGLPIVSVTVLGLLAFYVGELAVHAINTSLVSGVIFLMISNHHVFFTHFHVTSMSMSRSTCYLQICVASLNLLINMWFYCGGRLNARTWYGDFLENLLTCSTCDGIDSDEEAYLMTLRLSRSRSQISIPNPMVSAQDTDTE